MNVDNQFIVHAKADHVAPDALLEAILAKKPTAFGFVVQNEEDGKPELSITREDAQGLVLANLKELMENAKHRPLTMYFGKLQEGQTEDIQPFIIHDGDDNPFITLMIEGTINGHDDPKAHTEQYNFCQSVLIPKILEWCNDFEGDLDKIMAKLNGEVFNNDLLAHIGHRAVLHIVPVEGDIITLGKNELGEVADWGMTSQHLGYADVKTQEPAAEAPQKKKFWAGKKGEATAAAPANPPGVHTVGQAGASGSKPQDAATPGNVDHPVTGKAEGGTAPGADGPAIYLKVPDWCRKNDDIKTWYKLVFGTIPGQWKKRIPIEVKAAPVSEIQSWRSASDMANYKLKQATASGTTETKVIETPAAQPAPAPAETQDDNLPIIPAKDLEKVLDTIGKFLDGNSKEILDPKDIQSTETMHIKFSESVGAKPEEILNWPVSGLFAIGKTDYRAAVLMALEFRNIVRQMLSAGAKMPTVTKVTKTASQTTITTTEDLGNGGKKTETVVVQNKASVPETKVPDAAPAAKKGFWSKKAA